MRSTIALSISSLILLSQALPFRLREPAIRPRAKYSVVAVDGSSGNSLAPTDARDRGVVATTIVQTQDQIRTVTAPAKTQPPATETIISTKIVEEKGPAKTVEKFVTKDISEDVAPTSKLKIEIVNAEQPTKLSTARHTTTQIVVATSKVGYTTSSPISIPTRPIGSNSPLSKLSLMSSVPTLAPSRPGSPQWQDKPKWAIPSVTVIVPTIQAPPTTKSYDNGMWHASYPSWNATSATSTGRYPTAAHGLPWKRI
ncbi:MAG: hypothetical protein Q9164_005213 [Protoblastenia rupestris]